MNIVVVGVVSLVALRLGRGRKGNKTKNRIISFITDLFPIYFFEQYYRYIILRLEYVKLKVRGIMVMLCPKKITPRSLFF